MYDDEKKIVLEPNGIMYQAKSTNLDGYGNDVDDEEYDKKILLYIQKCCLLKQYKNDKYIKRKWRDFDKLTNEIMYKLEEKCDNIMQIR